MDALRSEYYAAMVESARARAPEWLSGDNGKRYFVDALPRNCLHLWLIAALFPEVRGHMVPCARCAVMM